MLFFHLIREERIKRESLVACEVRAVVEVVDVVELVLVPLVVVEVVDVVELVLVPLVVVEVAVVVVEVVEVTLFSMRVTAPDLTETLTFSSAASYTSVPPAMI